MQGRAERWLLARIPPVPRQNPALRQKALRQILWRSLTLQTLAIGWLRQKPQQRSEAYFRRPETSASLSRETA